MDEISVFHTLFTSLLAGILALGLLMAVGAHVLIRRIILRPLLEPARSSAASPKAT